MDKFMDNPWFLRGIALLFAMFLFFVVQSEEEAGGRAAAGTDIAVLQDVPVEVYFDDENTVVTGVPESVNLTIEGPATLVQTTKTLKDFTLFVDLRTLTMGEHTVSIQTENISEKMEVQIDPEMVDVIVEERITREFRVDPEMNERLLAEHHIINSLEADPATVIVTGAKSVVESISFVKASITADAGVDGPLEQQAPVRVLDRDLNKLNVDIEPAEVTVMADISEYSRTVPLSLNQNGTPEEGVTINSINTTTDSVKLFGPRSVIDSIGELEVDVDMSEVSSSGKMTVELKKPAGVTKISPEKIEVDIQTTVNENDEAMAENTPDADEPETAEEEEGSGGPDTAAGSQGAANGDTANAGDSGNEPAPAEDSNETANGRLDGLAVEIRGLEEGQSGELIQPPDGLLSLKIHGSRAAVDQASAKDFTLYVNADGLQEGETSLDVHVIGPDGIEAVPDPGRVTVRIMTA